MLAIIGAFKQRANGIIMKTLKAGMIVLVIVGQMILILNLLFSENKVENKADSIQLQNQLPERTRLDKLVQDETRYIQRTMTPELLVTAAAAFNAQSANNCLEHPLSTNKTVISEQLRQFREQEQVMNDRLKRIREKCSSYTKTSYWQNLHLGGRVWTYLPDQINYCIVPKVGCTFWKRIMRFLGKDYPKDGNVQRPSDIDRTFVHYGGLTNILQSSVNNPIVRMLMTSGKSFMFTRDPFSRLWSAYIDKFLLPDFWRTDALAVVKRLRPNATEYERKCANNVTFDEFLSFIKLTYKTGLNEHWDKTHRLCSPCHVQYDVIGKQESFKPDADFLLAKLNLEYLKDNTTKLDMVHEEVVTLTRYNFKLENAIRQGCFDKMDVARRLWLAFQFNGYIDRNSEFPELDLKQSNFTGNPITTFMDCVFKVIDYQNKKGINIQTQKRTMMLEAYRNIPSELLHAIIKVYEYDFELFEYKKTPFV